MNINNIKTQMNVDKNNISDIKTNMHSSFKEMKKKLTVELQNSMQKNKGSYFDGQQSTPS